MSASCGSVAETVVGWAAEEFATWPELSAADYEQACESLQQSHSIFVIDIDEAGARIRPKVGVYVPHVLLDRAEVYARYCEKLRRQALLPSVAVLIDVNDEAPEQPAAPVFSFQRRIGSRNPLLPDLDTIATDFYAAWHLLPDTQPFRDKHDSAIFVGSTTGVATIMAEHLSNPFPRLRAYRFFRDVPNIHFRLPAVVQAYGAELEALLAEGLGGPGVSWRDQLPHKVLLSMDGNGAALSRPYIGLASNCALAKYASNCEAWYFRRLKPGEHFILVERDEDVLALVEGDMTRHEPIAHAGRAFVERYLTPAAYDTYTRALLTTLASRIKV